MANPLTGDFDAVLQISGGTINRLLASMHQQSPTSDLPHFPHSAVLRIGDTRPVDRVRGTVRAQIGVPRLQLIHGATDRFLLEVGVRVRYRPDSGTKPLPQFIHGTVRAEYRIERIDPNCVGWRRTAHDHIWVRVVKDTVTFTGTAFDDHNVWEIAPPVDEAALNARIVRQIATLLATEFEARPEKVSGRFKSGAMRSLSAGGAGSAVALAIPVNDIEPVGDISSVNNLLLDGSDFAVGVRLEFVMSLIEPMLAKVRALRRNFSVYSAFVTSATIRYEPHGTHALLHLEIKATAETDTPLPNFFVTVNQILSVTFDAAGEVLRVAHFHGTVTARSSRNALATEAMTRAAAITVRTIVQQIIQTATAGIAPSFAGSKGELVTQLRKLDDQADAWFDGAEFGPHGLVLRGTIGVAPRRQPELTFEKTAEEDGYSALLTWIPGGRIDSFTWSWSWFGSGSPGVATHDDRFVLRRPQLKRSRWGRIVTSLTETTPLPGLDGMGTLCFKIKGVVVDPWSGDLVPVESRKRCVRFGFPIRVTPHDDIGSVFWRTWPEEPELSRDVPFPELALLDVGSHIASPTGGANTLVVYVGEAWTRETVQTLREGLGACRRHDAGLAVMVLFRDGVLSSRGRALLQEVEEIAEELGAPVLANEDVHGTWSAALAFSARSEDQAWRLISPGGGVTWMHDGRLRGEKLASVLDEYLITSSPAVAEPVVTFVRAGDRLPAIALHPDFADLIEPERRQCPPPPVRTSLETSVVAFAHKGSASSHAQLRELHARHGEGTSEKASVLVVMGGADQRDIEALKNELGVDFSMLPDPSGAIARRFGIRFWPTTVAVDGDGVVTDVEFGHTPRSHGVHHDHRGADAAE